MRLPLIYTEEFKLTVRKNTKFFLIVLSQYSQQISTAFEDSFAKLA